MGIRQTGLIGRRVAACCLIVVSLSLILSLFTGLSLPDFSPHPAAATSYPMFVPFAPAVDGWAFANGSDLNREETRAIWSHVFGTGFRANTTYDFNVAAIFENGLCEGLSASAASYYTDTYLDLPHFRELGLNVDYPFAYKPQNLVGNEFSDKLAPATLRKAILEFHISQMSSLVHNETDSHALRKTFWSTLGGKYKSALREWVDELEGLVGYSSAVYRPQIIDVFGDNNNKQLWSEKQQKWVYVKGGHALVASGIGQIYYFVEPESEAPDYSIYVYDPNDPGAEIHEMLIDVDTGWWEYEIAHDNKGNTAIWSSEDKANSIAYHDPLTSASVVEASGPVSLSLDIFGFHNAELVQFVDDAANISGFAGDTESWDIPEVSPWAVAGFNLDAPSESTRYFDVNRSVAGLELEVMPDSGGSYEGYLPGSEATAKVAVTRSSHIEATSQQVGVDRLRLSPDGRTVDLVPAVAESEMLTMVSAAGAPPLQLTAGLTASGASEEYVRVELSSVPGGVVLQLTDMGVLAGQPLSIAWEDGQSAEVAVPTGSRALIELTGGVADGSATGAANLRVRVDTNKDGQWDSTTTGTLPAPGGPSGTSFTDTASSPYRVAIEDLAGAGIVSGYPDGTFRPDNAVLRQHFAKMIVLGMGLPVSLADLCPFGDVEQAGVSDDPLYPDHYVAVAAANGITQGVAPGLFGPYWDMTRAQLITMVVRAAEGLMPGVIQTPLLPSAIYDAGPHTENIQKAAASGLLDGLVGYGDPSWNPWTNASRGEVAQILYNLRGHEGQDSSIPSAPTNLAAVALSSSSIRFTWADVSNEEGYIIMQGSAGTNWTEVGRTAANVTSFTDTGLAPSTDYWYCLGAFNGAGTVVWYENNVYATTLAAGPSVTIPGTSEGGVSVATIHKGDVLHIQASGIWGSGGIKQDGTASRGGPEGIRPAGPGETGDLMLPGQLIGLLIGRVGNWVFPIGASAVVVSQQDGTLYLLMNDRKGFYGDNDGSVTATVTITSGEPLGIPNLRSPAAGVVYSHYPRTTTLAWDAVPGATGYLVEVEFGDPGGEWWAPLVSEAVSGTSFTFDFVGMQPGRWRVTALGSPGRNSLPSVWRLFEYTV